MTTCTADRHNTLDAYKNHGCTCPEARLIWARYCKEYQWRRARGIKLIVNATGTRRRLHALQAIGYRWADIAQHLNDVSGNAVSIMSRRELVHVKSAAAVTAVYNKLWDTPGPSDRAREYARQHDWPPPLFWDDDLIDDPTYQGETEYRNDKNQVGQSSRDLRAEHALYIADLSARGWSAKRIAEHLGCSSRRVVRLRAVSRMATPSTASDPSGTVRDIDQREAS
jgi:hypothetical protein